MESQPFLLFNLNSSLYGVEAVLVQEIFFLPELTPITEVPLDIVGVFNLRGQILPVMDINLRLRQRSLEYSITDSVIVLSWENIRVGIIVNQVEQVELISAAQIDTNLSYGRQINSSTNTQFIRGIAQVGADLVMLLNAENLLRQVNQQDIGSASTLNPNSLLDASSREETLKQPQVFCPNATPEERAIFRERAHNLMRAAETQDFAGLLPLAVIGLDGEYFALDMKVVREFTDIRKVTPIPCCPSHIVGNMNLRGEILTLIDIRGLLNLEMNESQTARAMVVQVDDLVVGVVIDQVFDIMYLNQSEIMPVPSAVHSTNDEYLRGTAIYREKMMGILEMSKIIKQESLVVDEEV